MKPVPFGVTLRNGSTAIVLVRDDYSQLWRLRGKLTEAPVVGPQLHQWRSDGRWACDGHDHPLDIVHGLDESPAAVAQHETTEAL